MKITKLIGILAACALTAGTITACGDKGSEDKTITVITRESGSGTRDAFIELVGIQTKDAAGNKQDHTTEEAIQLKSTDEVLTQVAGDENAIGYISLGSLNDSVKALNIAGVQATADNVKNGTYKIQRPFNIVTKDTLSDAAKDFYNFILSKEGQTVITNNKYIAIAPTAAAYASNGASGKVVVLGSSSVTPVMQKLQEAYKTANPNVTVEVQESDSSAGVKAAQEGTCDIGMASRALKDTETGVTATQIALDGIAVIVNKSSGFTDITTEQVRKIYTGETTSWDDV
ncbi:MAG: substrate-binding domain-containing protein [Oscillospiraceae bacterium]